MENENDRDIKEVLRQERGRGKRYVPSDEEKEAHRRRKEQLKDILRVMTWGEVVNALSQRKDTPEYEEYCRIWKNYQRDCGESY